MSSMNASKSIIWSWLAMLVLLLLVLHVAHIPSFISPMYFVPVGNSYSPFPSILPVCKNKPNLLFVCSIDSSLLSMSAANGPP